MNFKLLRHTKAVDKERYNKENGAPLPEKAVCISCLGFSFGSQGHMTSKLLSQI